ncbi:hypothetical protein Ga0061061_10443 [Chelatococcus sambhunathii]|uniref:DUF2946 domain-containing protein n=2 Tax=Chelatococcus TaxID=28209 RepID=A0AAC9JP46_9HYPH|nr:MULTISPECIES: DUF2946 family protein [Chelatococcus]APF37108.1 hypothetical protein BOQ54_06990 [Chelatococcus daeguensis]CUA87835.1 hypothetical protein Ga0061061_10443 [Chelatococcus sambhunathii]
MRLPRLLAVLALAYALALQALLAGAVGITPAAAADRSGVPLELAWCMPGGGDHASGDEAPGGHHDLRCILACGQLTPSPALLPAAVPSAAPVARAFPDGPVPLAGEPLSRRDLSRLKPAPRAPPLI